MSCTVACGNRYFSTSVNCHCTVTVYRCDTIIRRAPCDLIHHLQIFDSCTVEWNICCHSQLWSFICLRRKITSDSVLITAIRICEFKNLHAVFYRCSLSLIQSCLRGKLSCRCIWKVCIFWIKCSKAYVCIGRIDHLCIMTCNSTRNLIYPVCFFLIPLFNSVRHGFFPVPGKNFAIASYVIRALDLKAVFTICSFVCHCNSWFCSTYSCNIFKIRRPFDWHIIRWF